MWIGTSRPSWRFFRSALLWALRKLDVDSGEHLERRLAGALAQPENCGSRKMFRTALPALITLPTPTPNGTE